VLSKPFCNTPTTERYPLPQPLGSPKAESRAEEHIEDVFTNIANAAKHRGVQPHDETPRLKHEAAHADEADDPPSASGCWGEGSDDTAEREGKEGGRFLYC